MWNIYFHYCTTTIEQIGFHEFECPPHFSLALGIRQPKLVGHKTEPSPFSRSTLRRQTRCVTFSIFKIYSNPCLYRLAFIRGEINGIWLRPTEMARTVTKEK